ncbi:MAG: hypothetical protein AAF352_03610, partial [Pseudomonadota bacterium]
MARFIRHGLWQHALLRIRLCAFMVGMLFGVEAFAQAHLLLSHPQADEMQAIEQEISADTLHSTIAGLSDEKIRIWLIARLAEEIAERDKVQQAHDMMSIFSRQGVLELRRQISAIWIGARFEWGQMGDYLQQVVPNVTQEEFLRLIIRDLAQILLLLIFVTIPYWLMLRTFSQKFLESHSQRSNSVKFANLAMIWGIDATHIAVFYMLMLVAPDIINPWFGSVLPQELVPISEHMVFGITMMLVFRAIIRFLLAPHAQDLSLHNIPASMISVLYPYLLLIVSIMVIAWEVSGIIHFIGMGFEVEFLAIAMFQTLFAFSTITGLVHGAHISRPFTQNFLGNTDHPLWVRAIASYWWLVISGFVLLVSILFLTNVLLVGTVPSFDTEPYLFVGLAALPVADKLITDMIRNYFHSYHTDLDTMVTHAMHNAPEHVVAADPENGETATQNMDHMVYVRHVTERIKFKKGMMLRLEQYFVKLVRRVFVIAIIFIALGDLIYQQQAYGVGLTYITLLNITANLFFILVVGWFLSGLIVALMDDGSKGIKIHTPGQDDGEIEEGSRSETLLPLFRTILQIVLLIIILMTALAALGIDIAPLLASAGIIGIAIGFGAQA